MSRVDFYLEQSVLLSGSLYSGWGTRLLERIELLPIGFAYKTQKDLFYLLKEFFLQKGGVFSSNKPGDSWESPKALLNQSQCKTLASLFSINV